VAPQVSALAATTIEMRDDRIGVTADRGAIFKQERRDLIRSGLAAELLAIDWISRHGPRDVLHAEFGHAEFGEPLPHSVRVRTPLGLV
jgi:hypothetical protein